MKTDATLAIEKALAYYDPAEMCGIKTNKFRGRHIAFEVPAECGTTQFGIVDAVQVSEYFSGIEHRYACYWQLHKGDGVQRAARPSDCAAGFTIPNTPRYCGQPGCVWKRAVGEGNPDILITCFEIKVTKADFKSANGHNFVGNLNYYVVPLALYHEIKSDVPKGIGLIAFYDGSQATQKKDSPWPVAPFVGLRRKIECEYRELTDEAQKWLVLSVLKRIRRGKNHHIESEEKL